VERFYNTFIEHFKGEQPTSILEIGSRDGHHAEILRSLSNIEPYLVNIVEPHPVSFRRIINTYPSFRVFELAVSDKPGIIDFNAIPYSKYYDDGVVGFSSILKRNAETCAVDENEGPTYGPENWVKVLAVTGQTILQLIDRWEIDLVKIDVEGFTYEVLKSFGPDIRLMRALHLEVEAEPLKLWQNQHGYKEVQEYMSKCGFKEMYYVPMYWAGRQGDSIWIRID